MKNPPLSRAGPPLPTDRGFTLIELLTVIAIIGILAAILIPVVSRVRQSARNVECLSNVRSWGQAIIMYAHENDGYYAVRKDWSGTEGVSDWVSTTSDYNDLILQMGEGARDFRTCPLVDDVPEGTPTYALNWPGVSGVRPPRDRIPLGIVTDPSNFLLVIDAAAGIPSPFVVDGTVANASRGARDVQRLANPPLNTTRHEGRMNASFGDGHVRTVYWEPKGERDRDSVVSQWTLWTNIE